MNEFQRKSWFNQFFFEFRLQSPHSREIAWKRLLDVTDNRSTGKVGVQDFLEVAWGERIQYLGHLKPYEFWIRPVSGKKLFGLRSQLIWVINGTIEEHWSGCIVKGYIRPKLDFLIMLGLLCAMFFFGLLYWMSKPQSVDPLGLVMMAAMALVMFGIWKRASKKHENALRELLDGKDLRNRDGAGIT